jgi:predicted  nucleic acid-binding Zn-ribbon protein
MPHQCLKCGSVFADGSPQILRGCPGCGGTRFFFTESKMSDEERSKLQAQAKKDIKTFIQEMMTNDTIPINIKEKVADKKEWVQFTVVEEEKDGATEKKVEVSDTVKSKGEIVKSIEDLVFPKQEKKKFKFSSKADKVKKPKKAKPVKAPAVKAAPAPQKKAKKKDDSVAVITIDEDGIYDIDVERLMEHSPIIVQKDGSYMVHLPSAFKKGKKKGSMA